MRIQFIFIPLFLVISCQTPKKESFLLELDMAVDTVSAFSPGFISDGHAQRDLALSGEGNELFYSLSTPSNGFRALVHVRLNEGEVISRKIASFSGNHDDIEPFFAPDQERLFFSSNRPVNDSDTIPDYNIWYVERMGADWGQPIVLGDSVNTPEGNEFYPSVSANGNLYFTASYERRLEFIWKSEWKDDYYTAPVKLDSGVNSSRYQFNAWISPDESLIVFSSFGRDDGFGGGDLYVSRKDSIGKWEPAQNLGPGINSDKLDYCPFIVLL
jgi:hypothetical protein